MSESIKRAFSLGVGLTAALLGSAGCAGDDEEACSGEPGTACLWAGVPGQRGFNGDGLPLTESTLGFPTDLAFGPDGRAWVADFNNHRIRVVADDGTFTTVLGNEVEGDGDPNLADLLPLGAPAGAEGPNVSLNHPSDIDFMSDGSMVLAAWHNNKVRQMTPDGVVTVMAGDDYGYAGDDGPAYLAEFNAPKAVVCDPNDNVYVLDQRNQRIRRIAQGDPRMITTVAGIGTSGYAGDGGDALAALFHFDEGVTPVPSGSLALRGAQLYVADSLNHRIRVIDLEAGTIALVAGTGEPTYAGDGGAALEASLNDPTDLEFGPDGRLYVADSGNNVIRAIDLDTGVIDRVAGNAEPCSELLYCYEDEGVHDALAIQLLLPWGIAFDPAGDLFIADTNNQRIMKVAQ